MLPQSDETRLGVTVGGMVMKYEWSGASSIGMSEIKKAVMISVSSKLETDPMLSYM